MRVVAGDLGGRVLNDPRGHRTHPMSEKARGALFNTLGDISGLCVLDAFAGSGAVAIEALSRGASPVFAVEIDTETFKTLKENRDLVADKDHMQIHRANVSSWVQNANKTFDVIVADPPYDDLQFPTIETLNKYLNINGVMVVSLPSTEQFESRLLEKVSEKIYGDMKLAFFKKLK